MPRIYECECALMYMSFCNFQFAKNQTHYFLRTFQNRNKAASYLNFITIPSLYTIYINFKYFHFALLVALVFRTFSPLNTQYFLPQISISLCKKKKKLVALHKLFNRLWQQNPLISFTVLLGMRATVKTTKKNEPRRQKQSEKSLKNAFNYTAAEMWQLKIKAKDQKSRLCSCLVMMISLAVFPSRRS